jgi:integrase/recombinase XerD
MSKPRRGFRGRPSEMHPAGSRRFKLSEWPEGDRIAWEKARDSGDILGASGAASTWSDETCRTRSGAWGQYLCYLATKGLLDPGAAPGDRLTPERLAMFVATRLEQASAHTVAQNVIELSLVAKALAPDRDWSWVRRHRAMPTRAEVEVSKKPLDLFDPVDLLAEAITLMNEIDDAPPTLGGSVDYRDALIVALLTCRPIRRRNLAMIRVGKHLVVDETCIRLAFDEGETKTFVAISTLIPEVLESYLRRYLDIHRPRLLKGKTHDALWVSCRATPLSYGAVYGSFYRMGRRLIDRPVTPHMFRYAATTLLRNKDPADTRTPSAALGHRSRRTAASVYDRSGDRPSQAVWRRLLAKLKRGSKLPPLT